MNNYRRYFGTPEITAITLSDFFNHSKLCTLESKLENDDSSMDGVTPDFGITMNCTIPSADIGGIAPAREIYEWLMSEVSAE